MLFPNLVPDCTVLLGDVEDTKATYSKRVEDCWSVKAH
jgi:hypothetical protein